MTDVKHTPTPWEVFDRGELLIVAPEAAWTVGCIHELPPNEQPTNVANAAFIVTACNAHEALVEALQDARQYVAWFSQQEGGSTLTSSGADTSLANIDAALATLPREVSR